MTSTTQKISTLNPKNLVRNALGLGLLCAIAACSSGGGGDFAAGGAGGGGGGGGGGKGGGGGGGGGGGDKGRYTIEDYDYEDKLPKKYHPLGKDAFVIPREETAVFASRHSGGVDALLFDDADAKHKQLANVGAAWPQGYEVFDAAGGQLDGDFANEIVAVALVPTRQTSRRQYFDAHVRVIGTAANGSVVEDKWFRAGVDAINASLDLADVDGDGRDEIVLTCAIGSRGASGNRVPSSTSSLVRVFDDSLARHALMFEAKSLSASSPHQDSDGRSACGDFDGDGKAEIVFMERPDSRIVRARVFDDATMGFAERKRWSNERVRFAPFAKLESVYEHAWADMDVIAGDFDGDKADEILFCGVDVYDGSSWELALYDGQSKAKPYALLEEPKRNGWSRVRLDPLRQRRSWQLLAADLDGSGTDGALLHVGQDDGDNPSHYQVQIEYRAFGIDRELWGEKASKTIRIHRDPKAASRVAVVRDVLERRDRVMVAITDHDLRGNSSISMHRVEGRLLKNNKMAMHIDKSWTRPMLPSSGKVIVPVVAGADLQGDGLGVRFTGKKTLKLANPTPICVMAAPPTKAGVSQNYDDSEVSYGRSTSKTVTHTVSVSTTISSEMGVSFGFFDDFFSVDVRKTYEESIEKSHGKGQEISRTVNFVGGHEEDHIVFQGTVYQHYEYVIVISKDPQLVGKRMSIDVPVASRVYKWTLAYFNSSAKANDRLKRSELFKHTIGKPETYLTHADAKTRVNQGSGWLSDKQTVGQGRRSNSASFEVKTTNTSEKSRSVTTGITGEIQIGPFVGGGSVGSGRTNIYAIETSVGSLFEGVVGDFADPGHYTDWSYDFGLAVYHKGGGKTKTRGYQVLNFWVTPTGAAY